MLTKLDEENQKWGLMINVNNTENIVVRNRYRGTLLKRKVVEGLHWRTNTLVLWLQETGKV